MTCDWKKYIFNAYSDEKGSFSCEWEILNFEGPPILEVICLVAVNCLKQRAHFLFKFMNFSKYKMLAAFSESLAMRSCQVFSSLPSVFDLALQTFVADPGGPDPFSFSTTGSNFWIVSDGKTQHETTRDIVMQFSTVLPRCRTGQNLLPRIFSINWRDNGTYYTHSIEAYDWKTTRRNFFYWKGNNSGYIEVNNDTCLQKHTETFPLKTHIKNLSNFYLDIFLFVIWE